MDAADGGNRVPIQGAPGNVSWSPDGKRLAVGRTDYSIRIASSATGAVAATLYGHRHMVAATRWSPDGGTLASVGIDDAIRLWDAAGGRLRYSYLGQRHDYQHALA